MTRVLRRHRLDEGRHARQQAAAADADEDRVQRALALCRHLLEDFPANGALTGNHQRVIVGRDVGGAARFDNLGGVRGSLVVGIAVQHHLAAEAAHRIDLDGRGGARHHDP